jgi:hypothetical protein
LEYLEKLLVREEVWVYDAKNTGVETICGGDDTFQYLNSKYVDYDLK